MAAAGPFLAFARGAFGQGRPHRIGFLGAEVVNRGTAKRLGIVVPPTFLIRADRVIE